MVSLLCLNIKSKLIHKNLEIHKWDSELARDKLNFKEMLWESLKSRSMTIFIFCFVSFGFLFVCLVGWGFLFGWFWFLLLLLLFLFPNLKKEGKRPWFPFPGSEPGLHSWARSTGQEERRCNRILPHTFIGRAWLQRQRDPKPRTGAAYIGLGEACLTPGLVMH